MSIDVRVLAYAWANVMDGRRIGTARIGRDTTTPDDWQDILAEYARLVPAADEGRLPCTCRPFFDGHVTGHPDCPRGRAEDEGPKRIGCICPPGLNDASCPAHGAHEDEGRLRELVAPAHESPYHRSMVPDCAICAVLAATPDREGEGWLREALRPWLHHTDACAQRGYGPTCTCGLDDALAATPEPRP
jgi:hypothetical protein